jgi:penicillin-binding protein 1C
VLSFSDVKNSRTRSEALLLDRNGEVIHEMRIDDHGRRLEWIVLRDISPALVQAVLVSEDKRFYRHSGVDWIAAGAAALKNIFSSQRRGASTITMQLAALLERRQPGAGRRSWREKWRQIQQAKELEKTWTKEQILEAYLNLISFRGELQGVGAASQGLLGKEAHGLDETDASILAALIRSPNANAQRVTGRACALSRSMRTPVGCDRLAVKINQALSRPPTIKPRVDLAPHAAAIVLRPYQKGTGKRDVSVVSTLDGGLQRFAVDTLREQLLALRSQNVKDGAVLVADNKTGAVLAYVGSSGDLASARYVDGARAPRQPGSTLKPFLYALAFEKRILTPMSLLDDSAADIPVPRGIYRPRNYDERFHGLVSARAALASSLNVPAVRTLTLVGVEPFLRALRDLGFTNFNQDEEFYGPALALGSADVTLWELVNAYRTLANSGRWGEMTLTPGTRASTRRVFSEQAVFLLSNILSDRESRSLTFGLEGPLATRFWSAVKTGTSKEMRDNWCIGYSSKYTVGVWIGNFSGEPMWNVSGMSGAAPVWLELMNRLHRDDSSAGARPPAGVARRQVEDQLHVQRAEWFIEGTEPVAQTGARRPLHYKIVYPVDGAVLAFDPDIPQERQKIFFDVRPRDPRLQWVLDGVAMGPAGASVSWSPKGGTHTLALIDGDDRVADRVVFLVRGVADETTQAPDPPPTHSGEENSQ